MSEMITPPVSTAELAKYVEDVPKAEAVVAEAAAHPAEVATEVQKLARPYKTQITAAVTHIAVLLVSALSLHLSASQISILGSIVAAGVGVLLTVKA